MKMQNILIFSLFPCLLSTIFFQSTAAAAAESSSEFGADFLGYVLTPNFRGMGDAFASLSSGANSLNSNPAGIAFQDKDKFEVGSVKLPELITVISKRSGDDSFEDFGRYEFKNSSMEFLSLAFPHRELGGLGFSLIFRHEGEFSRVDSNGRAVNGFPETDASAGISYGLKINDSLAAGIQAKRLRSKMSDVAGKTEIGWGYAFDVGFIHKVDDRTRFGATVRNLGKRLHFKDPAIPDRLRTNLVIGGSYRIVDQENSSLTTEIDINPPFKDGFQFSSGAEFWYLQKLALRLGYIKYVESRSEPFLRLSDKKIIKARRLWKRQGVSFGLGLKLAQFEVDLASTPAFSLLEEKDERSREETNESIFAISIGRLY
jgi:hypothetical protein